MTKTTPPVPPDDLIAKWDDEYERLPYSASFPRRTGSKYVARQAAAWGWEQSIPEREELAGLLMEMAETLGRWERLSSSPLQDRARAAAERLRGGGK
jgi:hypothetical protein